MQGLTVYHPRFFSIPKYIKIFDIFFYFFSLFSIVSFLQKSKQFDIIDLHWTYPEVFSGKMLSHLYDKKWIINVRGKSALNISYDNRRKIYSQEKNLKNLLFNKMIGFSDSIITLSDELKSDLVNLGISDKKIQTIPNGVNSENFYFKKQNQARSLCKINYCKLVILSVGNIVLNKGFDRVIRSISSLRLYNYNINYFIIGTSGPAGNDFKKFSKMIAERELQNNVFFLGTIDNTELINWYNAADLFCLPSRSEGCPNVLMEALACGCPCVATNVGMVADIFQDSFMGKLVDNSQKGVQQGLEYVLSRQFDRQKIAESMKQYSWDECAKKVLRVYEELLNEG